MKKLLNIFMILLLISGLIVAVFLVQRIQNETIIKEVVININYYGTDYYILKEDVYEMLSQIDSDLMSKKLSELHAENIEEHLEKSAFISSAEVYLKINGVLKIEIHQRHPIARIETSKSSFYIGSDGALMPISNKNVSHVMIINGHLKNYDYDKMKGLNINYMTDDKVLADLLKIANYIHQDEFLRPMIEQIYLNKEKEYELVPKLGRHYILLGTVENMEEKLQNLQSFYQFGISQTGWNKYKMINLKYKNQVVCTKI